MHRIFILLGIALLISCSSAKDIASATFLDANEIVTDARSYIGTRYQYAGNSRNGMDCSGLVSVVYSKAGVHLPRTTSDQSTEGRSIHQDGIRPGDLLFFKRRGKIFHVGIASKIYKNKIWMIHSSSSKGVVEQELSGNSYWLPKLHRIQRIL